MRAEQVQEAAPAFVHMWYKRAHIHGGTQQCISPGLISCSSVLGHGIVPYLRCASVPGRVCNTW